ncbi:histone acetyltransferase KAT6B-like isoform X2 [Dreissena polymorpha]|uniref:histone acetyltransferase KAT6B-like isoform X2 n=1 Tax=Dreissena polymorpha TaxID=45954 RepID=UPI002264E204|nr:histone acetyltransferase KAT6B-like isoform X2 [Dreissena polymorpha]
MSGKVNKELFMQHKQWCVDMIEIIKLRKARPSLERIAHMLKRSYGLTESETEECLSSLMEEGSLTKVVFKGVVSYRKRTTGEIKKSPQSEEHTTSLRIISAIRKLTKETGQPVSFKTLESWLISKNPETRLVKNRLENAIQKQINAKTVVKLADNCYTLPNKTEKSAGPSKEDTDKEQVVKEEETVVETKDDETADIKTQLDPESDIKKEITPEQESMDMPSEESLKRGRPLSKRKKFKKTHGPDFEENPLQLKRAASRESTSGDLTCGFCAGTSEANKDGVFEDLLMCKDCHSRAHPSCMDYSPELAQRALNSPWQCMDCKTCCMCDGAENDDLILFCDACDKGYHMICHNPPVMTKPKGKWVCSSCKRSQDRAANKNATRRASLKVSDPDDSKDGESSNRRGEKRKLSIDDSVSSVKRSRSAASTSSTGYDDHIPSHTDGTVGAPCLPTPSASPRPGDTFDYEVKMSTLSDRVTIGSDHIEYEDATNWSIEDVEQFFNDNGFGEHAHVFRTQEVDGRSLLLMRRNDVLTALGLKLGPALKIFQKILRIQQHSKSDMFD